MEKKIENNYNLMAQSNFSGTSLWLLVLGRPTCLFTDCLLCWVDIFALCRESSSLKKEETSSVLQTRCFVDRVSSSPSDSSEDIIDKCNASNNSDFFSSSVTTISLFSSFLLILCLLFCSLWYCSYVPFSICLLFLLLEAKF